MIIIEEWFPGIGVTCCLEVFTGYSQNSSQSLGHLRSWAAGGLMFKKTPASHQKAVFNNKNNNNDNNNNTPP